MPRSTYCNDTPSTHTSKYPFVRKQQNLLQLDFLSQFNVSQLRLIQKIIIGTLVFFLFACQSVQSPQSKKSSQSPTAFIPSTPTDENQKEESLEKETTQEISKASLANITGSIMAEFSIRRGNLNDAYKRYIKIAKETQDIDTIKRTADIALTLGNINYIAEASEYWLKLDAKNAEAYALQFKTFISTSQTEQAAQLLTRAMNNDIDLDFLDQEVNRNSRETEKIKIIYDSLALLSHEHRSRIAILTVEARLEFILGNLESAIAKAKQLKKRIGSAKLSAQVYLILAYSQHQTGMSIEAIKNLETGVKYHSDSLRLLTTLLDFLLQQGQLERSRFYFEKADLEQHQALQLTMNYVGQMIENNFVKESLELLQQVDYESSGLSDQFHFLKANALVLLDRKQEALIDLLKTDNILKNSATQQAAAWMYDLNLEDEINNMVLTRIDRENNLDMILEISSLHEEFSRLDLADEILFLTLQQHPEQNNIRYRRALINEQIGLRSETEKELRYLIRKEPKNPQYLNALGYVLLSHGPKLQEAMLLIKEAYSLSKDDPAIIDSLGWGYFLLGDIKRATHYLERAWTLLNDPEIGAHLGEVLWRSDKEKANQIWHKSLEIDNKHRVLLETIHRLAPDSHLLETHMTTSENTPQDHYNNAEQENHL